MYSVSHSSEPIYDRNVIFMDLITFEKVSDFFRISKIEISKILLTFLSTVKMQRQLSFRGNQKKV